MRIAHVRISNILGIDELEFSPAGFNVISGRNGEGKTSILEAIKAAIKGGHDATLLRKGASKGEVVLVLDDGTELGKTITEKGSTSIVKRDGKKVARPQEAIRALVDMLSVNPVDFLLASKKDRVRVLLEAMPIDVDVDRLSELSGMPVKAAPGVDGLHLIEMVRQQVYDDRTGTNRAVKEKEATINQLQAAMPDMPGGVDGDEDDLRQQVEAANAAKDAELERIRNKLDGIKKSNQERIAAIRAEAQRQIDEIMAEERAIEGKAATQREKTIQKHAATVAPLNQALEAIRTNRSAVAKRAQALSTIKTLERELETLVQDAQRQTQALADIDAYKSELLASLPIPGLEVRDGEIYRDGVPFDRLNTAQQVQIAVELAKIRAGELGVVCVDRIEMLDSESFELFRESMMEADLQLFVTRVTDDEFSIETTE